jgi:uncharacterized protein (DUF433 family)
MYDKKNHKTDNHPQIGHGIFLPKDISHILDLPYHKVRHWVFEFWDNKFGHYGAYSFGQKGNKAIDFHTLIEFYVFYQLRSQGISSQRIQKVHNELMNDLDTKYPFAHAKISTDGRGIWYEKVGNLIKVDGKNQFDIKDLLHPFLKKIEFGKDDIAERYFPLTKSKNIVIDPKRQFGQPIINGTSIRIDIVYKLYQGGESAEHISSLYNITPKQVNDAILYYQKSA